MIPSRKKGKHTPPPPPTFVIFDFPFFAVLVRGVLLAPLFVFGGGVKRHGLGGFRFFGTGAWDTFHDGGDEDLEKIFNLQQTGPKMVEKIHNQPFDVAAVVVLVGHDHDVAVAERLGVGVNATNVQTHNLHNVLHFGVLHHRLILGVSHIQQFTFQRKYTKIISPNDRQPRNGQGFGGISLRQYQCTIGRPRCTGPYSIVQFGD